MHNVADIDSSTFLCSLIVIVNPYQEYTSVELHTIAFWKHNVTSCYHCQLVLSQRWSQCG